ncbi:hypothetical protein GCM10015535_42450 [Streptomyces gelaticus]|uniref:Uncharacterized protein n=1 Tax=Streptomyces gelaticus TaxID=285446 RepID=A0ABQ2W2D0_9ACTN|nr:hypothetical protein GCM10015535_42450 [Streptomyces gelaticus]
MGMGMGMGMGIGIATGTGTGVLAERQVYLDSHPIPQQHPSTATNGHKRQGTAARPAAILSSRSGTRGAPPGGGGGLHTHAAVGDEELAGEVVGPGMSFPGAGVMTAPGATALQRPFCSPYRKAIDFVMPATAA